jgi:hypothetical protein
MYRAFIPAKGGIEEIRLPWRSRQESNMMKTWKCCSAAAVAALACAPLIASAHWPSSRVSVEIVDRNEARVLPVYAYAGRRFVVGKPGNEYAIRVRNTSGERVLAVMSVDGVNVITGETASPAQSGYVLGPYEATEIAGWRKDMTRTAAFYFTALPDSYAARTGRPDNVGVIGVAVFRERPRPMSYGGISRDRRAESTDSTDRAAASPMPAAPLAENAQPKPQLGTGHGRSESSYAQYTSFDRASDTPGETIALFYDSYENLLAQGVPVGTPPVARYRPEPFPERGRFVPDPR